MVVHAQLYASWHDLCINYARVLWLAQVHKQFVGLVTLASSLLFGTGAVDGTTAVCLRSVCAAAASSWLCWFCCRDAIDWELEELRRKARD